MDKPCTRYRKPSSGYQRGRGRGGNMNQGEQLCADGWEPTVHAVVHTEEEIECCNVKLT